MTRLGGIRKAVLATTLVLMLSAFPMALAQAPADHVKDCGPIDFVFIIDTSGSYADDIGEVKAALADIFLALDHASAADLRTGLVGINDEVVVHQTLTTVEADTMAKIMALVAFGGAGFAESSDEALNTVVNLKLAADRPPGKQIGDWTTAFDDMRGGMPVRKIIVLATDAPPGGFDDVYTPGVDDVNAHTRALEAAGKGIKIGAIDAGTDAVTHAVMMDYAATTGGKYILQVGPAEFVTGILDIIGTCGGVTVPEMGLALPLITSIAAVAAISIRRLRVKEVA